MQPPAQAAQGAEQASAQLRVVRLSSRQILIHEEEAGFVAASMGAHRLQLQSLGPKRPIAAASPGAPAAAGKVCGLKGFTQELCGALHCWHPKFSSFQVFR